jgi:hypothetical protein
MRAYRLIFGAIEHMRWYSSDSIARRVARRFARRYGEIGTMVQVLRLPWHPMPGMFGDGRPARIDSFDPVSC